jgi:hypothetical protein
VQYDQPAPDTCKSNLMGAHRCCPVVKFDLLGPVRHAHFVEHDRRACELLPSLLAIVRTAMELTEAKVAMGDERTRAQLRGKRQATGCTTPC